jgi:hypothetical protein
VSQQTVNFGLYRFFTKAQLDAERLRYVQEVQKANSTLAGAGINGQTFTFSLRGRELSLEEWGDTLAAAYNSLGVYDYGTPGSRDSLARF